MGQSLGENMIDKDVYPQIAGTEPRCVYILADLWNSPDLRRTRRTVGCDSGTGGTVVTVRR